MIKNCPCGSADVELVKVSFPWICCHTCGMSTEIWDTDEQAIAAWNRRPAEEELLEIIKQVQKVFDLGNCDEQEAFMEWLKESNELAKNVDELLKKYEGGRMKYAKNKEGEIHAINPANGEYTLCGNAFEGGFDDEFGKEETRKWEPIPDGVINCPHCKYIIKVIKNENYKMF